MRQNDPPRRRARTFGSAEFLRLKKILALAALMLPLVLMSLPAMGGDQNKGEKPKNVEVSGRVRLVGSGPQTKLVITGKDREWYINEKDRNKLMNLQQQIVTVKGRESFEDLTFASGISAGRRYLLENITVIRREQSVSPP
jgi:hypothetical protein